MPMTSAIRLSAKLVDANPNLSLPSIADQYRILMVNDTFLDIEKINYLIKMEHAYAC